MSTPELIAKYIRLDRAIGAVMPFFGISKSDMSAVDQSTFQDALAELDAASDELQKVIYSVART